MYADNLREAVKLVKTTGFISRPLCGQLVFWKRSNANVGVLYARLLQAMKRLEIHYLINANR